MSRQHDRRARLPIEGDNCAIATRTLEPGVRVSIEGSGFELSHTVLEGHRLTVKPIPRGAPLLSWGLPFGTALRDLHPGEWVCNEAMLSELRLRRLNLELPESSNFSDVFEPFRFIESEFEPGRQVSTTVSLPGFEGYRREGGRGVGTRSYIVLLATTSRASSYVRLLRDRVAEAVAARPDIDGVVAVAHTEGGTGQVPNNRDLLLRTLFGFLVHPNVLSVLAVDSGPGPVSNSALRTYAERAGNLLESIPHSFLSLSGRLRKDLEDGVGIVRNWTACLPAQVRTPAPLAELKLALQCGGSDAFSGVTANPLIGRLAAEIIRQGGSANLAETDELIGAEPYVLSNVRDTETAREFLEALRRFEERVGRHGQSAQGNPSGGNRLRGLYNITLKSIGAALKKTPEVRLDFVIPYGRRMREPGYYFMDSPGNDLESVAGQVASGANLILFTTGNGSITNFPFVPTVKVMTTSRRYELLDQEMDVNAGALLDGEPMEALVEGLLEKTRLVASGRRTKGEDAGHSQVSLWRDWALTGDRPPAPIEREPAVSGQPLRLGPVDKRVTARFLGIPTPNGIVTDRVGLVLPTSLCAAEVSRTIAAHLDEQPLFKERGLSRFVALVHTEGCGCSGGPSRSLYDRTLLSYAGHPMVAFVLFLEHGCEITHNDYLRREMESRGVDASHFGFASIQLDGGLQKVTARVESWFTDATSSLRVFDPESAGLEHLRLGIYAETGLAAEASRALAGLIGSIVHSGGTVVVPEGTDRSLLSHLLGAHSETKPSLAFGETVVRHGFHLMETPTIHPVEILTGLGATGAEVILAWTRDMPIQAHPLIPVLQISQQRTEGDSPAFDVDLLLRGDSEDWPSLLLDLVCKVASRQYSPRLFESGYVDFQITRGHFGVSL